MSYHAGILGFAGVENTVPRIVCDTCGAIFTIALNRPTMWFLDGKAPPKWKRNRRGNINEHRRDACPTCVAAGVTP